ncbi:MAG: ribonuclease III [Bacteroidetes bacterium QS_9_68_14]|nr:MAG: ribonuclease III [Bacteroidetes bacterium QS_9_68_14]
MPDAPDDRHAPDRSALEALVGRAVEEPALYAEALTHRSLTRGPQQQAAGPGGDPAPARSNERLEFLGDALLGAEVAEALFHRFPDKSEGALSRLRARMVSEQALARCAERLGLGPHLRMSENADRSGARHSQAVLADAFEALVGAVYLDLEAGAARSLVRKEVLAPTDVDALAQSLADGGPNYKSRLQEHVQARRPVHPAYRVAAREGPPHDRTFTVEALVEGEVQGTGTAASKKEAEQRAAREALEALRE